MPILILVAPLGDELWHMSLDAFDEEQRRARFYYGTNDIDMT